MQPIRRPVGSSLQARVGNDGRAAAQVRAPFSDIGNTAQSQPLRGVIKPAHLQPAVTNTAQNTMALQAQQRSTLVQRPIARQPAPVQRIVPTVDMIESLSESLDDLEVEDIDAEDINNPQECVEYVNGIHTYLKSLEPRYQPDPMYMTKQTDITDKMRAILIDWYVVDSLLILIVFIYSGWSRCISSSS